MQISFHGAAGDVTGSCHLLEVGKQRILIDCGLFQGSKRLREENSEPFGFDPASVDVMLLTHAHLDHCGRIPLLVKQGFKGRILTTAATVDLAKLVLLDAAHLQEEEAERYGVAALFGTQDAEQALPRLQGVMAYGTPREIAPGVRATFGDAGHILGSAWILLEVEEGGTTRNIVFSGDLGNPGNPILRDPQKLAAVDTLVMESTYGDRNHRSRTETLAEFRLAISQTLSGGGNVVIPTFALERAQDLLFYLRQFMQEGSVPNSTPVFLDSPMAISATEIFRRHPECFDPDVKQKLLAGDDPFALPRLQFTQTSEASRAIAAAHGAIIMAGSGMATGGRVLHHLKNNLDGAANRVILVGYAAAGTPARALADGVKELNVYGNTVKVQAQVSTIGGFSAHAGHDDLIAWAESGKPRQVLLVHGEAAAAAVLARDLEKQGLAAHVPHLGETWDLAAARTTATGS
jgi:metallo-beta-lactamase family protein